MESVTVRLHAGLERYASAVHRVDVDNVLAVSTLQLLIGIPAGLVGMTLVDGKLSDEDAEVSPGAVVDFYPPIAGS